MDLILVFMSFIIMLGVGIYCLARWWIEYEPNWVLLIGLVCTTFGLFELLKFLMR